MLMLLRASPATEVIVTILVTIVSLVLIFFLYKGIGRERLKYAALSNKSSTLTLAELKGIITKTMSDPRCEYTLIEITINDVENIEKVCGPTQFAQAIEELMHKVKGTVTSDVKFAVVDKEHILVYARTRLKKETLELLLRNMIREINKPITLIGSLYVEFDINVAAVIYQKGLGDLNTVIANLELTTMVSKKRGRNTAVIFDRSVSAISTEQYTLYTEIKEAIKNNDFRIFYQPIIYTKSLECFAVEAYLRWQHAEKGIISPDVFMPSLEHSGDINWVGVWAFEAIVKQLEYWQINNSDTKIKINVNWSITQLSNPTLCDEVRKILRKFKVSPSDFYFEIPNYKLALTIDSAQKNISVFRQLGIGIAIDNLNLEVTTVMDLDKDNVNMLKFNRDFCNKLNLGNESVKNIAQMISKSAAAKNILVVGEGVEDDEMLEQFKEVGIPLAQGYYFSKPKAPTEAMADIMLTPWKK